MCEQRNTNNLKISNISFALNTLERLDLSTSSLRYW